MRSDRLGETLLPKRLALPVFASDALSSVAYAPDEILLTLGLAGGALALTQLVEDRARRRRRHGRRHHELPAERARLPLGWRRLRGGQRQPRAEGRAHRGAARCSSTTSSPSRCRCPRGCRTPRPRSASSAGTRRSSPWRSSSLLTAMNLRGVRESGAAFAVPVYLFMVRSSAWRSSASTDRSPGTLPAGRERRPRAAARSRATRRSAGIALAFLLLRAFSSGCAALTGVEAISNGVPAFRSPRARTPPRPCCSWAPSSITMLLSMVALARWTGVKIAEDPATQLTRDGVPVGDTYVQDTVMGQVSKAVFSGFPLGRRPRLDRHRADPRPRREHRLQRLPGARLDPRPRRLPAPPAAHPRRPARVLQRHHHPRRRGGRLLVIVFDAEVTRAHPALHRRRLRLVHAEPDRHGAALDPPPARSSATRRRAAGCCAAGSSTPSARRCRGTVLLVVLAHEVHPRGRLRHRGDGRALRRS